MLLASDYPFLDVLWTIIIIFAWVIWFWLLITVFADVFRRRDIGGGAKTLWIIFVIILPFLGVFIYLIAEHEGMAERNEKQLQAQQASADAYIQAAAGKTTPAGEIDQAKKLLDSGTITQQEFDALKAKALGSS